MSKGSEKNGKSGWINLCTSTEMCEIQLKNATNICSNLILVKFAISETYKELLSLSIGHKRSFILQTFL